MKVVIMPRERSVHGYVSLNFDQCLLGAIVVLVAALFVGGVLQRSFAPTLAERLGKAHALIAAEQPRKLDSLALDELYAQVGVLQAKSQQLEALSRRVIRLAGLPAADLQIVATGESRPMPKVSSEAKLSAGLVQRLSMLQSELAHQTDHFGLLDLALTKHAAMIARKPTGMPIGPPSQLSSTFGWRRNPFYAEPNLHEGLDFAAPAGTPIWAASGGVVRTASYQGGFGNLIEIDHGDGLFTRYAHAKVILVKKGDLVRRGQMIARVGSTGLSTGPHLHFEVRQHDQPLDPRPYLTNNPQAPGSTDIPGLR
jgi:murein DD-endopeptidase MepM/ murein hydrolase activator NlpD